MTELVQATLFVIGLLAITASDCHSAETMAAAHVDKLTSSDSMAALIGTPADPPTLRCQPEIEVILASEADVSKGTGLKPWEAATQGFGAFVSQGMLTPIAGPIAAVSAVGGVVLAVVGPPAAHALEKQLAVMASILQTPDFTNRVEDTLLEGLRHDAVIFDCPDRLKILVSYFGLQARAEKPEVFKTNVEMCFVLHAQMVVEQNGKEMRREDIDIGLSSRSQDAPPPLCAEFSKFAENEGAFLRATLSESADVLARIILARLENKP